MDESIIDSRIQFNYRTFLVTRHLLNDACGATFVVSTSPLAILKIKVKLHTIYISRFIEHLPFVMFSSII